MAGRAKIHDIQTKTLVSRARKARRSDAHQRLRLSPSISRGSVTAHALETFGSSEKVDHWMNRPNSLFDGKTPAQRMKTDLVSVEAELVRIDHGVYM